MMYNYKVGELYHPTKRRWPDGVIEFNISSKRGAELRVFFGSPSQKEIDAVKKAPAR